MEAALAPPLRETAIPLDRDTLVAKPSRVDAQMVHDSDVSAAQPSIIEPRSLRLHTGAQASMCHDQERSNSSSRTARRQAKRHPWERPAIFSQRQPRAGTYSRHLSAGVLGRPSKARLRPGRYFDSSPAGRMPTQSRAVGPDHRRRIRRTGSLRPGNVQTRRFPADALSCSRHERCELHPRVQAVSAGPQPDR